MIWLTKEAVQQGHSVLVFCRTRKDCEVAATKLARFVARLWGFFCVGWAMPAGCCSKARVLQLQHISHYDL